MEKGVTLSYVLLLSPSTVDSLVGKPSGVTLSYSVLLLVSRSMAPDVLTSSS